MRRISIHLLYIFSRQDFDGRAKVREWIGTLEGMTADETLSETEVRQMIFDLESAYNAFNRLLQHT